ncbi:zinc finger, CW-type containing protein [Tanacetum coccineum]
MLGEEGGPVWRRSPASHGEVPPQPRRGAFAITPCDNVEMTRAVILQLNDYIEPTEISSLECASYQDWGSSKLSRLSPIGNWLQCRHVVDDVVGTVCGKWRRAPLFEVQTDNWECFSSILWDQTHADCAVPQELDTEQVLKQLKYIELLRPRLSAKKWKLGVNKKFVQREHSGDPRSTQKS